MCTSLMLKLLEEIFSGGDFAVSLARMIVSRLSMTADNCLTSKTNNLILTWSMSSTRWPPPRNKLFPMFVRTNWVFSLFTFLIRIPWVTSYLRISWWGQSGTACSCYHSTRFLFLAWSCRSTWSPEQSWRVWRLQMMKLFTRWDSLHRRSWMKHQTVCLCGSNKNIIRSRVMSDLILLFYLTLTWK